MKASTASNSNSGSAAKSSSPTAKKSPAPTSPVAAPLANPWKTRQPASVISAAANAVSPAAASHKESNIHRNDSMHERMLYLLANLVGLSVRATLHSGSTYEGIFHGANTNGRLGLVLKMATVVDRQSGEAVLDLKTVVPVLVIEPKDLFSITATDVDVTYGDRGTLSDRESFQTDTAISGHAGDVKERVLEKWTPDSDAVALGDGLDGGSHPKGWDQFAANEKLFGIKTDFREEMYTTKLNKNSDEYKRREREAHKLAAEIEKSGSENIHIAEERGHVFDDSQVDEEDRYGAVVRKSGSYVPPAARKSVPASSAQNSARPSPALSAKILDEKSLVNESPKEVAKEKTDTITSPPVKKTTLNPNATSFKFNAKASEFKPVKFVPPVVVPQLPIVALNIFGRASSSKKFKSRKDSLFEHFKERQHETETVEPKWKFGHRSYVELADDSITPYPTSQMPHYGYPPFPIVQQPFVPVQYQNQQQAPYGGNPYMQGQNMQYGFQPMMMLPNNSQQFIQKPEFADGQQGQSTLRK